MAKRKNKKSWLFQIIIVLSVLISVLFSAMAILLAIGMLPTLVSSFVDRTEGKIRTVTIAAMNFAGCMPFIMEVIKKGGTMEAAITYIVEPRTIVVMYFAAAMGYMVDWAMTGIVSSLSLQKTKTRLKEIEKIKAELVERWGVEVSGTIPLDEYGFPIAEIKTSDADVKTT